MAIFVSIITISVYMSSQCRLLSWKSIDTNMISLSVVNKYKLSSNIYASIYLFIYLSINLSIYLSMHPSVRPEINRRKELQLLFEREDSNKHF